MVKIYDYKPAYNNTVKRLERTKILSAKEKKLIEKFDKSLADNRTSFARRNSLMEKLLTIRKKYLKQPLNKPSKKEIKAFCKKLNNNPDIRERTRNDYKSIIKQFYTWHNGGSAPDYVVWIRRKQLLDNRLVEEKTAQDILTQQEQKKLLNACTNKRDYAMIKLFLETGLRPAEMLRLKIKHIDFRDNKICMLTVPSDTKTGARTLPFIASVKALLNYLETHPHKTDNGSWLWTRRKGERDQPLKYKGLSFIMQELKKDAGIKKRFHAYIFRYTSYTNKARAGWSEQKIKTYHGLAKDSKMLAVYVKMEAEELIDDVLELAGKKVIKRKERQKAFTLCPRCSEENEIERKQCKRCGMILDLEEANKAMTRTKVGLEKQLEELRKDNNELDKKFETFKKEAYDDLVKEARKRLRKELKIPA